MNCRSMTNPKKPGDKRLKISERKRAKYCPKTGRKRQDSEPV